MGDNNSESRASALEPLGAIAQSSIIWAPSEHIEPMLYSTGPWMALDNVRPAG